MEVVVTKDQLQANRACGVYLDSPEWDKEREALVYSDWSATVERLLSTRPGTMYLDFLVVKGLVPMTVAEFNAAKNSRRRP